MRSSPTSSSSSPHNEVEPSDSDGLSSHNSDVSESDESSADEKDSGPLPVTESTVLSHAERRRQKKRKLNSLAAASESGPVGKKRKLDESAGASSLFQAKGQTKAKRTTAATPLADDPRCQKRQNSIWVGNMSFRTTVDALRGFFDGVGTITRVHMPMRRGKQEQGENMGFAYIDFETPEAKVTAITLSEGVLDGRNLLIKDGNDFGGRPANVQTRGSEGTGGGEGNAKSEPTKGPTAVDGKGLSKTAQKILRSQKQPSAPTLFLGNLGFETTEESIRGLFEGHRYWRHKVEGKGADTNLEEQDEGENGAAKLKDVWIRKIRMGTFEDSGACKGFAFVDFTSIEHATEALINPRNHRLNGRDLVVEYASPDAVRRGGGGPRPPKSDQNRKTKSGCGKGAANAHYTKRLPPQGRVGQEDGKDGREGAAEVMAPRSRRPDRAGQDRSHPRRAKPGAALAHAQRQSAAILPGQGQKIVF